MSRIHTVVALIDIFSLEWNCAFVQFVHKAATI